MPRDDPNDPNLGISRRQLIKRGAVVGGTMMWMTPVVESFTNRAFAAVGTPVGEDPCPPGEQEAIGYVKWDVGLSTFQALSGGRLCISLAGDCLAISEYIANHLNEVVDTVVLSSSDEEVCITLPDDCSMFVAASAKEGKGCDTTIDGGDGVTSVCFVKEGPADGVSNVQIGIKCCVPAEVVAQCA